MRMIATLLLLAACESEPVCGPSDGVVARVLDGDTVVLTSGETVRYLLVDTPEWQACFGPDAARMNRALVEGQPVSLRYDRVCRDRYDRLLAFVQRGGREVNALLLERGYACVLYLPPAGSSSYDAYERLEAAARAAGRGLWGACPVTPCE
jgi:micrococcal nuclease